MSTLVTLRFSADGSQLCSQSAAWIHHVHATHLLKPDIYSRFFSFGGKFMMGQARSPSPGDRAQPDGFVAQSHPCAASRTRVRLGHKIRFRDCNLYLPNHP